MKNSMMLLPFAAVAMFPFAAGADVLNGQTVGSQYFFPDLGSPYAPTTYSPQIFVVGAGQESTIVLEGVTTFNVDFADLALDIAFDTVLTNPTFTGTSFNGLVFTSPAFAQITGVTIGAGSNLAGFDAGRVSLVGNELRLNWAGLTYDDDTVLALDFTGSVVPEPATWGMMIVGIAAAGAAMRRRRIRASQPATPVLR